MRLFLAPTTVGERWLSEAETERGTGSASRTISRKLGSVVPRFAATSPPFHGGEELGPCYRSSLRKGFSSADGATALRDMKAMATMVKMKGSIRNAS